MESSRPDNWDWALKGSERGERAEEKAVARLLGAVREVQTSEGADQEAEHGQGEVYWVVTVGNKCETTGRSNKN